MNKRVIILLFMLVCTVLSFAKEKYPKPKTNEVVIITRFSSDANFNEDFFLKYYDISGHILKLKTPKDESEKLTHASLAYTTKFKRIYESLIPLQDDMFFTLRLGIPENRVFVLSEAEIYPAGIYYFRILLPFNFEITIPEGVNYVYLGTFHYEMEGIQYDINSITLIDEFEKAEAFVKEKYGEDAELVRIPVTPVEGE